MLAWQLWLALAVLLAIGELVTTGFFLLWFALGAGASALGAGLGLDLVWQVVVFLAVSGALVLFTRPVVQRFIERKRPLHRTNVDALAGKVGTVVKEIDPFDPTGQVKVQGETWTAVSPVTLKRGALVVVERVEGVRLHVKPVEDRPPDGV